MNHEVPQPVTATRSPGAGSPGASAAASAARRQQAGWVASSRAVRETTGEAGEAGDGFMRRALLAGAVVRQSVDPVHSSPA